MVQNEAVGVQYAVVLVQYADVVHGAICSRSGAICCWECKEPVFAGGGPWCS